MPTALHLPADGVLFDNDGVLVDSDATVFAAWTQWARALDLDPDEVLALVHGRRAADTVAHLFGAGPDADAALRQINDLELATAAEARAIPGAAELTSAIPSDRWAVVTSGTRALASARLRAAGLWPVPVLVSADDVAAGKPAPDGYRQAAAGIGRPPASTIVLEDVENGVRAARAAEVAHVIGIGERALGAGADVVVTDLRALRWTASGIDVDPAGVLR